MSSEDACVQNWETTLEKIVKAVVAIKFCSVRHFDTESTSCSVASGFIVNKELGIVLTNRHVVTPGPVKTEARLLNHEEVDLIPIYRDPVHDFGMYKYNPEKIKFMEVEEISLTPQDARVGCEIRVVGNDAGEKLSILSGTLARLDRTSPHYGAEKYNDFNTFYYQAASSTSGGSSGSPIVNIAGNAVAMNAGGRTAAASSFYLPLDRVARVLELLIKQMKENPEQNVWNISNIAPRGTLQTIFKYTPYNEVVRLGLDQNTEAERREAYPDATGLLVVDKVLSKGPSDSLLEPGDILIRINQIHITSFIQMEDIFDTNVDKKIMVQIQRGGKSIDFEIKVQDLHSITPNQFLETGGSILHKLSYQQAKNYNLPVGGLYLCSQGFMLGRAGLYRGCIITHAGKTEISNIKDLCQILILNAHGSKLTIRYFHHKDRFVEKTAIVTVDHLWHPTKIWTRNDKFGVWDFEHFESEFTKNAAENQYKPEPKSATSLELGLPKPMGSISAEILASLVLISLEIPYLVDGIVGEAYQGTGLIIDAEKGIVLTDQNTVPTSCGNLTVTISTLEIPASVIYLHPIHNYSLIQYDSSLVKGDSVVTPKLDSDHSFSQGDDVYVVGFTGKKQPFIQKTSVSKVEELFINEAKPPRFRATHEETIHLDKVQVNNGAVIADQFGKIRAFWCTYSTASSKSNNVEISRGFPVSLFLDTCKQFLEDKIPLFYSLEAEMEPLLLSKARHMGLTDEWVSKIEKAQKRRYLLSVRRLVSTSDASTKLKTGDMLLCVDSKVVASFPEFEKLTQKPKVTLTIVRNENIQEIEVETKILNGNKTNRMICWNGALLQDTHRAVLTLGYESKGVFCSRWYYGSPSHAFGLRATSWITHVNEIATPNLDKFIEVVNVKQDSENVSFRLKIEGFQNDVSVITLKPDELYWPLWQLHNTNYTWKRELL